MNFLGKNIRHLRKQFNQTQSELADLMGKGQTTVGNWENGVSEPSLEELLLLSNYFGTPLDILIKVDLSLTSWEVGRSGKDGKKDTSIKEYDPGKKEEFLLREPDDASLAFILQRLNRMQEEIDRIKEKLK
jgi:transcriptional regulator with XRE-family HTH domain